MATVADPTDPGTRRPNEPPAKHTGDHFEPMARPKRAPKIEFPCEAGDALALFQLFFPDEELQILADNTKKNAHIPNPLDQGKAEVPMQMGHLHANGWIRQ